jgi:hypothetical protein
LLLHRESKLQWLLLPSFDHFLPEFPLMLNSLQLRLDVLLGNLQQSQNTVVGLLRDHVKDIPETL